MNGPDTAATDTVPASPGILRELLVEVFLARGAAHHDDLQEAAGEFRELLSVFGVLPRRTRD